MRVAADQQGRVQTISTRYHFLQKSQNLADVGLSPQKVPSVNYRLSAFSLHARCRDQGPSLLPGSAKYAPAQAQQGLQPYMAALRQARRDGC